MMVRMRAVVVVALVVALGVFAGMLPSAEGGVTETGSSTSGGCLPPTLGVDLWAQGFPSSNGPSETLSRDCEILCGSHLRKCRRIVRLSRTCNSGTVGAIAELADDVCDTISDHLDRRSCRRGSREFKKDFRACVKLDAETAGQCCDNNFPACVNSCVTKGAPVQQCFTEGSCLFDLFNQTMPE